MPGGSPTIAWLGSACVWPRLSAMIGAMKTAAAETAPLPEGLTQRVLRCFGLPAIPPPSLNTLRLLLDRYTRTTPWESASRIARRAQHTDAADCALLGEAFWESHFMIGTGGTCYESNYAFFALLRRIGYDGYLTINDMGSAIGCHSAIVVLLDGRKHLVDVGLPLHAILPLREGLQSTAESAFMRYTAKPLAEGIFEIWRSVPRDEPVFQLNDKPVAEAKYRAVTLHDYRHDGGQFLNEVVIRKVLSDQLWRFNSSERPLRLQQFVAGARRDHMLGDDPASEVADKFGIASDVVAEALAIIDVVRN